MERNALEGEERSTEKGRMQDKVTDGEERQEPWKKRRKDREKSNEGQRGKGFRRARKGAGNRRRKGREVC